MHYGARRMSVSTLGPTRIEARPLDTGGRTWSLRLPSSLNQAASFSIHAEYEQGTAGFGVRLSPHVHSK